MKLLTAVVVSLSIALSLITAPAHAGGNSRGAFSTNVIDSKSSQSVDYNEEIHLIFMRQEEKLARDVYIYLGIAYPRSRVFGNIDDSEQVHMDAVADKLDKYGIPDPVINDNTGVFTGEEFGEHFTETYRLLTERGAISLLDAYYVGAFIEELDMYDINLCPDEILLMDNGLDDAEDCGKVYTDNSDIKRLYTHLLNGSESHLRAYVKNIERIIGVGNYEPQVLEPEELDSILGR